MQISRKGLHFRVRNAFWKDLFSIVVYKNYPKIIKEQYRKNRGVKLFFHQCYFAMIEALKLGGSKI